ncbi:MAG: uncharacterized protein PWP25_1964 [Sphaerochaeta sp.]|jgi:hypothetical protein|uniref:UPF0178 protein DYP60_06325 n=1 Tax=Sphaerochaeta halotolerans TaxID=2293840 RepID=A0A372MHH3_9SPIR|nr:DUF188 domain-containing protein [Sphaerochaeta halotolerans]MBG0766654.1 DUF188 domain-containing protein [Spirochaetaceae bacterium]MDK2860778.1 uncharacterized protein [Sphaerochaeta sp.]RFU95237.1 hypothetical protein DYP60_06325 [Sphaerochaeta halotolerans]
MFTLYVDADSCPRNLRQIILKAVVRRNLSVYFVADRVLKDVEQAYQQHTNALRYEAKKQGLDDQSSLREIKSSINQVQVEKGDDSADDWIVDHAEPPAIAITHDIPLAGRLVEKGITVLDDRGNTYTKENMAERLSIRNTMTEFRELGIFSEQHSRMNGKQTKAFSDSFDALLTSMLKQYS